MPSSVIHIVLISTYKNLLAHNRMILFFDFSDNLNLTHYNSNDFVQILVYKLVGGGEGKWTELRHFYFIYKLLMFKKTIWSSTT